MPVPCSSPINSPTKRPEPGLSPGARSMPGARQNDSTVPEPPKDAPPARQGSRGDSFSSLRIHGQD